MPITFVWFLLLLMPVIAFANSSVTCDDNGNQRQMSECALIDYNKSDKALNESYASLMQVLVREDLKSLTVSQRQWLKARDSFCSDRIENSLGGPYRSQKLYSCLKSETDIRNEKLQIWFRDKKVDLSCKPAPYRVRVDGPTFVDNCDSNSRIYFIMKTINRNGSESVKFTSLEDATTPYDSTTQYCKTNPTVNQTRILYLSCLEPNEVQLTKNDPALGLELLKNKGGAILADFGSKNFRSANGEVLIFE